MKKFISNILIFVLVSVVIYSFFIFAWGTITPSYFNKNLNYKLGAYGFMNSRINNANTLKDIDILFLGSSHAYRGFDVRFYENLGYKSFNLGSSAQTPLQTNLLLKRYLDTLNPKHIVYDVYPEIFDNDGVESALDLIANSSNDFESLKMALSINHVKVYNTLIFGYINDFFGTNSNYNEDKNKGSDTYIKNGFVEKELSYYNGKYKHDIKWKFKGYQQNSFEDIITYINSKNIHLSLVQVPVTKSRYKGYREKHKFDTYINKFSAYYNFNKLLDLNDTIHFYDTQHLNSKGVNLFNQAIKEQVLKK